MQQTSGSVAQLVEQWTFNPLVASSSLAAPTTNKFALVVELVDALDSKSGSERSDGSIPSKGTKDSNSS